MPQAGIAEVYGFSTALGGFIVGGWIDHVWNDATEQPIANISGDRASAEGNSLLSLYPRDDVKKLGKGFVLFLASDRAGIGTLTEVALYSSAERFVLPPSETLEYYDEERLFRYAKYFLTNAAPSEVRARFRKLLDRPHYKEADTLSELKWPVHFEVDQAYFCPPNSMLLRGWFLDPFSQVARLILRCGSSMCLLDPSLWVPIMRSDVVEAFSKTYGLSDRRVGFLAHADEIFEPGEKMYLEIELKTGEVGFRPVAPSFLSGLSAMKEVLSSFELRGDAVPLGYDAVIGPAIEAMNSFRLSIPPKEVVQQYGVMPLEPRGSIIIPLYGRIDFLEYQLAFFSQTLSAKHELIYVLDDPDRRLETQALATSCFARFNRPFTLIELGHNVGYAPANNIGLRYARGSHICFLNSDVFPQNPDWLECLIETELKDPTIGIVGALLYYEDNTLQHDGCTFERLPDFGDWPFPTHPGKGRYITHTTEKGIASAVTGACMVMERNFAELLKGFDEGYAIGDFEDTDLCFRVREMGFSCVVDYRASLYHLERQSQGQTNSWRMNLTLYNAWRFQRRWGDNAYLEI